jgi:hypothetical protein
VNDATLNAAVAIVVAFLMTVPGTGLTVAGFRRVVTAPR